MIALTSLILKPIETPVVKLSARYWLFEGYTDFPRGGMYDFVGRFSSVQEAKTAISDPNWAHILDEQTMRLILKYHEAYKYKHGGWEVVKD